MEIFLGIIVPIMIVAVTAAIFAFCLSYLGDKLTVERDARIDDIERNLAGANCGGCGYAGCSGLAAAIVKGEAPADACPVGGAAVGEKIAAIMGVEAGKSGRKVAFVACRGDCEKAKQDYEYYGVQDCRMVGFVPGGGPKSCTSGCLGFGSCVTACPFDAIHVVNGVAVVDREKCKACGKCVAVCPRHLISLIPYDASYAVACSSADKGPVTMKACQAGCIGCGLCARNCPAQAVTVKDFHATIDQEKCTGCGACAEKCPKKCIERL